MKFKLQADLNYFSVNIYVLSVVILPQFSKNKQFYF